MHCARLAKQTPAQYLAQHEQLLLDANASSPVDSSELLLDTNEHGKRRTPDRWGGGEGGGRRGTGSGEATEGQGPGLGIPATRGGPGRTRECSGGSPCAENGLALRFGLQVDPSVQAPEVSRWQGWPSVRATMPDACLAAGERVAVFLGPQQRLRLPDRSPRSHQWAVEAVTIPTGGGRVGGLGWASSLSLCICVCPVALSPSPCLCLSLSPLLPGLLSTVRGL